MSNPYDLPENLNAERQLGLQIPPVPMPDSDKHRIAVVGCGAIGQMQIYAYKQAGWTVSAICDAKIEAAEQMRADYYPDAFVTTDYRELLDRNDISIIDLALHLDIRPSILRNCVALGKHVMSQKPFVQSLAEGLELAELAEQQGITLAVNQNGRWAPHFRALREVIQAGHIGSISAADFSAYWGHDLLLQDHVLGQDPNLLLYDFTIHWFDLIANLLPEHQARSVYAVTGVRNGQIIAVPTIASIIIDFDVVQVSINMRASARAEDTGYFHVAGSKGSVSLAGNSLGGEQLNVKTEDGFATLKTEPDWFPHALIGSMADLMCSIEKNEQPNAHPRSSLSGLALCFAAMQSARIGKPVDPATVRGIDD